MIEQTSSHERIYEVVAMIPRGRVATYGQVARLAGLGRRARLVGYALHRLPRGSDLPWHRVINAGGRISFPTDNKHYVEQRRRLEAEQVQFIGDRIDLDLFRWHPEFDDLPVEYLRGADRS